MKADLPESVQAWAWVPVLGRRWRVPMSGMMQPNVQQAQQNVQPAAEDPQAKLVKLKSLLDGGLISQEDFDKAKAEVLKQLIG